MKDTQEITRIVNDIQEYLPQHENLNHLGEIINICVLYVYYNTSSSRSLCGVWYTYNKIPNGFKNVFLKAFGILLYTLIAIINEFLLYKSSLRCGKQSLYLSLEATFLLVTSLNLKQLSGFCHTTY